MTENRTLTRDEQYLFHEGTFCRAYTRLGAQMTLG